MNNNKELLDWIGEWAERMANCNAATEIPMRAELHVLGMKHSIDQTLREMVAVLKKNEQEVPLGYEGE